MFEGLKKKFSNFIDSLAKKEEQNAAAEQLQGPGILEAQPRAAQEPGPQEEPAPVARPAAHEEAAPKPGASGPAGPAEEEPRSGAIDGRPAIRPMGTGSTERAKATQANVPGPQAEVQSSPTASQTPHDSESPQIRERPAERHEDSDRAAPRQSQPERKAPKVSATTRIKGFIFGQVRITEKDAEPFIDELKVGMLQSDVNYDVAERITDSIRISLVGRQVGAREINSEIRGTMRSSIMGVLTKGPQMDIVSAIKSSAVGGALPFRILFLGPNGAGKTTTMAKVASMLIQNGITCVMSASDTFRAAAIEQTAFHAGKLGIGVIKGTYGADPASVAFDAISHAKAHGIMAVLIDSAGRQETNKSLIEELKKMARVSKPDMKVFIGESISGNALLEQVKALNEAVGLDGIILTKLDVDAKGGNTLSILSDTTVPILFFGTGEKYTDIIPYDPQFIVDNMLPAG